MLPILAEMYERKFGSIHWYEEGKIVFVYKRFGKPEKITNHSETLCKSNYSNSS
jgi:hypothetical protein